MKWDEFIGHAEGLGVAVSDEAAAKLQTYEDRLYAANKTINLTRVSREDCRPRHFLDSLSLSPFIPEDSSVLDIGTGAGLPGVVLALLRADLRVTLLDCGTKEIRFLESLSDIATFGLILERGEIAAKDDHFRGRYDVVTGRAVAPLATLAEISAPFARVGGLFIPQRAANEETPEFEELGLKLQRIETVTILDVTRRMPVYEKVSATPERFPRTWAAMKRRDAR